VGTISASLDVTAERRSLAGFNCRHNAKLTQAHMTSVRGTPRLAVAAENIRHLQLPLRQCRLTYVGGVASMFRSSSGL
jgi:hypothetical protein